MIDRLQAKNSYRNGKIEILRFIFSLVIVFYHLNSDIWDGKKYFGDDFSLFGNGRIVVEFFFLVSGFLLAKAVDKINKSNPTISLGEDTVRFIYKKVKTLFFPHIVIILLTIIYRYQYEEEFVSYLLERGSSVFFLNAVGVGSAAFIPVEWYISAMLVSFAIVYPLLRSKFDTVSLIVAPVGATVLIGYLIREFGLLSNNATNFNQIIRGLAGILLGVFVYRASQYIRKLNLKGFKKFLLIVFENALWLIVFYFIVSRESRKVEGFIVYVLAIAIAICFSRDFKTVIYQNKLIMFLGKVSLYIYLSQNIVRWYVAEQMDYLSNKEHFLVVVFGTILLGLVVYFFETLIRFVSNKLQNKISLKC